MKITNKTTKIIGVAGVAILPNESATISADDAMSSMVKHFAKTGKVILSNDDTEAGGSNTEPPAEEPPAKESPAGTGGGNDEGDGQKNKKPLSRMNKDELVEECLKLGLDVLEDDTKDTLAARIKAATAE